LNRERDVVGFYISGHPLDLYRFEIEHFTNCNTLQLKDLEKVKKSTIDFGGVISYVEERVDKNGNPFGRFTIEDYHGNHEFMLFKEDYVRHRNTLINGAFVIVTATVSESRWRPGFFDLRIQKIELLSDVLDKKCRNLILETTIDNIDDIFLHDLRTILGDDNGSCTLKFRIKDKKTDAVLNMTGSKRKFLITGEKLKKIEIMPEMKMELKR
jgi:DNA polymerase-3 subunit alpha